MKIPGWAYISIGVFMTGLSGYLYKFVPKPDGSPNNAMALFFFIGILFILVGFVKTFFKRLDDASDSEYEKAKIELEKAKHEHSLKDYKQNRVESHMARAYDNSSKQQAPQGQRHQSQYAQTHPYQGVKHDMPQHQQANGVHKTTNTINIIACKRCGDKNPSSANYCHGCGNRLI
ncbi:MAG: hypothetical protein ACP5NV_00035 [Candidatus Woesearchaeota archaeon]